MAAITLLIAGRGPMAALAARLAAVRGYVTTLILDSEPGVPTLFLGGREGVASLLEEESACFLGVEEASSDPALPLLLYLGHPHRLVGCRLSSLVSPEEEARFFPGLSLLQTALSPELDSRILLSVRKTSVRAPLGQRIVDWFLEPERQKESLPRSFRKPVSQILPHWESLLEDVAPFSGLSSRRKEDPESLRLLTHFTESRGRVIFHSLFSGSNVVEFPGVELLKPGPEPLVLERAKKGRGFTIKGQENRSFDRVLSLTDMPEVPLTEASCFFDPNKVSPLWPACVLLQDSPGQASFLILPKSSDSNRPMARLIVRTDGKENPETLMARWVDRWNAESLFPFLEPGGLRFSHPKPLVVFEEGQTPSTRELTPLFSVSGHYSAMVDPTMLPVVPEDFWADLSMAIPSLNFSRKV